MEKTKLFPIRIDERQIFLVPAFPTISGGGDGNN